ncbi:MULTISPECIES: efflux RND transporter periplasmic adaptor subunit [Anaeromyxobacter]|uniref:efflux RND transporter periplasmic adaptor subunit n=1 Tax=Anaeromyxobacter TaxID=161492 RepID=UPI001F593A5F|nr:MULTISPECIES: efflux RND transporter periplasmic adaptor subunit [unclassified Anaeromyxobacter]
MAGSSAGGWRRVGGVAIAVAISAVAVAGCGRGSKERAAAAPRPPVPVRVAEARQEDVPKELAAVGSVQPFVTVSIRPLVTGEIVGVFFGEGDEVREGQRLFQIDPRPYEAALAQARAAVVRARDQAANARADARRYAELVKREYVTRQQYEAALANASSMQADVAGLEAAVRKAELDLVHCRIDAPSAGRTGAVLVQRGNVVQANQQNPLVVITQLRPIYVSFTVPEQHVDALRAGVGRLRVIARRADKQEQGTLSFVNNTVDPAAGTILAKATFENAGEALWPGQFVDARVVLGVQRGAVVAPAAAIVSGQAGPYVYVVGPDDTVEQRPVVVAQATAREVVVSSGLRPGERVVIDGQLGLVPKARVAVKAAQAGGEAGARTQARTP